ncbi:MAG TPA: GNAT family N-acetyltransferase [Aeromicrobium sp.]|nr:GNAT family N-acetyltransferase [Aeromicrobium sp.]
MTATLSELDEQRFGIPTAKANVSSVAEADAAIDEARTLGARLLIVRCLSSALDASRRLEDLGARIMDVLVYFDRDLNTSSWPEHTSDVPLRYLRPEDVDEVEALAGELFRGYHGHYHEDPRLDRDACDAVYTSWARNSCESRDVADEVLIAQVPGEPIGGFVTLRLNSPEEGEVVVGGVGHALRRRGVYRSFLIGGMEWARERGASRMVLSTQITHTAVQKVWTDLGFAPSKSFLTFHRWFDD